MNDSRYVKKLYNMMINRSNANSWTNQIKDILYNLNLSEYWENQLVENETNFLYIVESKLIEISDNKWAACIARSNRYSVYRTFKLYRFKEDYLKIIRTRKLRKLVTCFRLGVSDIFVHRNRFDNNAQFVCPLCTEYEEDEVHFLLQCPVFHDMRLKYLRPFDSPPNNHTFVRLMSCDEPGIIRSLSLFIIHALKRRHEYLYGNIVEQL